ncbi:hypothetical protein [Moraxella lacunata]|uniref:hypothetical protein n=1 Tax=Moraxella lacunata TaxID=477 RepID=UPI003EE097DF
MNVHNIFLKNKWCCSIKKHFKIWTCRSKLQFTQKSTFYQRVNVICPYKSTQRCVN